MEEKSLFKMLSIENIKMSCLLRKEGKGLILWGHAGVVEKMG